MSPKVIEYFTIVAETIRDLEIKVNKFIEAGWQPNGGICVRDRIIIQPMVLYDKKE